MSLTSRDIFKYYLICVIQWTKPFLYYLYKTVEFDRGKLDKFELEKLRLSISFLKIETIFLS
ncbi:hypothetical protein [Borreliella bavariensis]|uniref:Uncharacterized protein n=1 Tax=Borrelia garinii subsp. bavariensis (strain ATCC BAA-2496 / DSM 23469 / PBi) TaxID=290434 RepID=A0A7M4BKT6_BORGP|nr:hypothetical protein [Borreliella bavariensis]AAU85941.1 hypothetical protein BGP091 [Borreliella bavariensis PBi]AZA27286.1 hypothetical protein DB299_05440 [Borreliella bavariensis PBi]